MAISVLLQNNRHMVKNVVQAYYLGGEEEGEVEFRSATKTLNLFKYEEDQFMDEVNDLLLRILVVVEDRKVFANVTQS